MNNQYFPNELKPYIFYLPISVEFIHVDNSPNFSETLINLIEANKKTIK